MVRKADVVAAASGAAAAGNGGAPAAPAAAPAAGEEAVPLRGPAAALAGYMDESLSIPTATSFRTLAVGVLDAQRRQINADLKAAGRRRSSRSPTSSRGRWCGRPRRCRSWAPASPSWTASPTSSCARASTWASRSTWSARTAAARCWCRWCATPAPLGFRGFREAYDDLVGRTRAGQVKPDELRGATMTLTNPGGLGTVASVPRLMPGQGTIVATGAIGYPPGLGSRARGGARGPSASRRS